MVQETSTKQSDNRPTLKVKLASALLKFRPTEYTDNPFEVPVPLGGSAADLISELNIPPDQRLMVIINSELVPADQLSAHRLQEADKVSLVPPIQAG